MSYKGLKVNSMYRVTLTDGSVVEGKLRHVQKSMFGDLLISVTIDDMNYGVTSIESLEIIKE